MSPHRAIFQPTSTASTQCDVGPVCVPIELLSTYFNLPPPTQCDVGPVCVPIELLSTYFNLPPPTQCGVGSVCIPIELLSTYFNMPPPTQCGVGPVCVPNCQPTSTCLHPPNVVLVQCVSSIVNLLQHASTHPMWCWSSVCAHRAIVNLLQPA